MPDVEFSSLTLLGKDPYLCDPSQLWIAVAEVWFISPLVRLYLNPPTHLNAVLLNFVVEALSIQFSGIFLRVLFHI